MFCFVLVSFKKTAAKRLKDINIWGNYLHNQKDFTQLSQLLCHVKSHHIPLAPLGGKSGM